MPEVNRPNLALMPVEASNSKLFDQECKAYILVLKMLVLMLDKLLTEYDILGPLFNCVTLLRYYV